LTDERAGELLHALTAVKSQLKKHSSAAVTVTAAAADTASQNNAIAHSADEKEQLESTVSELGSSEYVTGSEVAKRKYSTGAAAATDTSRSERQSSVPWAQFKGMVAADEHSCAAPAKRARAFE
jgi:hypothetical protein